MKLSKLVKAAENAVLVNFAERSIRGIEMDSRKVKPGMLFAAVPGPRSDGLAYVAAAIANGAEAVLSQKRVDVPRDVTLILVPDVRTALADLCRQFWGNPAELVRTVGVTGTNGKTTVATLSRQVLATGGKQAALISTCVHQIGPLRIAAENTTPECTDLQRFYAEMVERDIRYAAMEVSSHALDQRRVRGIPFEVAVFTNITEHEHLDYHGSFANYRRAKARLFEGLAPDATAVLNCDDPEFSYFLNRARGKVMTYGLTNGPDVTANVEVMGFNGMRLVLHTPVGQMRLRSPLVGRYNVLNLLAGTCVGLSLGVNLSDIATAIERFTGAPGRLERVDLGQDFCVLVDYAHNADGLRSMLGALRELTNGHRLIVVFGAGGDRDRGKRPLMGKAAGELADVAILTADNSRSEDTGSIIREIEAGFTNGTPRYVEPDRREAIRKAIEIAGTGDVVVIAGKGHETHQILSGVRYDFDDKDEARRALLNLAARRAKGGARPPLAASGIC